MNTSKKILLVAIIILQLFCEKGLPMNYFDPQSFLGLLVSVDPFRYNPPAKSVIKVNGEIDYAAEGQTFQLGVLLENNPHSAVDISISSNGASLTFDGSNTKILKFNSSDYSIEQKFMVTVGIDADANNEVTTISFTASGLETITRKLNITDDLVVSIPGMISTIQEGEIKKMDVSLSKKPAIKKTVTITSRTVTGIPAITMNKIETHIFEFTPDNYNFPQTLTLLAEVDDNSSNEDVVLTVSMEGSLDLTYNLTVVDDNFIQVDLPTEFWEGKNKITAGFYKKLVTNNDITVTSDNILIKFSSSDPDIIIIDNGAKAIMHYTTEPKNLDLMVTAEENGNRGDETFTLFFTAPGMVPKIFRSLKAKNTTPQGMGLGMLNVLTEIQTLPEPDPESLDPTLSQGKITVRLVAKPGGPTEVTVSSSNPSAIEVIDKKIVFDDSTYDQPKAVTIQAMVDTNQTSETVSIIFSTPGAPLEIFNVTVIDWDTKIKIDGASTVNEGGTSTVMVSLSGNPGISQRINLTSTNATTVTISPSYVILTPSNYSQLVTITGVQDTNTVSENVTITGTCDSNPLPPPLPITGPCGLLTSGTLSIDTVDDDEMKIVISNAPSILDEGVNSSFIVRLSHEPTTPLTVNLSSSLPGSISLGDTNVIFDKVCPSVTPNICWSTPTTITLSSPHDVNETAESVTIIASVPAYPTIPTATLNFNTTDDDSKPVFSGTTTVNEGGTSLMYVALSGDPGTSRTVTLSIPALSLSFLSFSPSPSDTTSLTFNSFDWNVPKPVTLYGIVEANKTSETVDIKASVGVTPAVTTTQSITVFDQDTTTVFTCSSPCEIKEGTIGFMTLALSGNPGTTRVISITSNDPTKFIVLTSSLSFNSSNWNIPQSVILSATAGSSGGPSVGIKANGSGVAESIEQVKSVP